MEVNQALTLGFACFTETAMLHHAFTTFLERNDMSKPNTIGWLCFYMLFVFYLQLETVFLFISYHCSVIHL